MAKKPEKKAQKAASAQSSVHVATSQLLAFLTRLPEMDEVLRKAGVQRYKLRTLLSDDEIYQATETRFDALDNVPFKLEPSEGDAAAFLFDQLKQFREQIIKTAADARLLGYAVSEFVASTDENNHVTCGWFGVKPMQWFEPRPDGELRYYPDNGGGGANGILVDTENKFCLVQCKATWENPRGEALLSRLYWPFFFRTEGWKFWAKFLERFGSPILAGTGDDTQELVNALVNAHASAAIAMPKGSEVKAITAGNNNGGAFEAFETALIRRVQKVVLGQTLTSGTDGGAGTRALGNVHNDVRIEKRNADLKLALKAAQWFVDVLCRWNGFEPHTVSVADEKGLEKARAERDKDLHGVGVRFTRKYIEDEYSLDADHFDLVADAPPQPTMRAAHRFADDGSKLTPQQQEVEDIADDVLGRDNVPIPRAAIMAAIEASTDQDDMQKRLMQLVEQYGMSGAFADDMTGALFLADVMGYVHSERGK